MIKQKYRTKESIGRFVYKYQILDIWKNNE